MGDTKGKQKVKKWSKNRKRMKCGTENRWGKVRENGQAAEEPDVGKRWELEVGTRTVEKAKWKRRAVHLSFKGPTLNPFSDLCFSSLPRFEHD